MRIIRSKFGKHSANEWFIRKNRETISQRKNFSAPRNICRERKRLSAEKCAYSAPRLLRLFSTFSSDGTSIYIYFRLFYFSARKNKPRERWKYSSLMMKKYMYIYNKFAGFYPKSFISQQRSIKPQSVWPICLTCIYTYTQPLFRSPWLMIIRGCISDNPGRDLKRPRSRKSRFTSENGT